MQPEAGQTSLDAIEERIVKRLRVEMLAISLGDDALLTEHEAATLLDVHPKTLYRMRLSGEIQAGYIGSSPRYSLGQIRRFSRELFSRSA